MLAKLEKKLLCQLGIRRLLADDRHRLHILLSLSRLLLLQMTPTKRKENLNLAPNRRTRQR